MTLDYGGILSRAWQITWKHKILWIFGILSALLGGRASFNFNRRSGPNNFNPNTLNPNNPDFLLRLRRLFPSLDLNQSALIAIALGILCVGLIIIVTLYVLHVIGRGGLIGGIQIADSTGQVSFGQAWGQGIQHFWTVLLIGLIVAIIGLVIAAASTLAFLSVCLTPLACVGFLLIAVLGVFTYLAQIAAVTQNLGVSEAIGRAWAVVQANLITVLILAVILVIIEVVIGLILFIPFLIALAPLGLAAVAYFNGNSGAAGAGAIISGLCVVVWIPVVIVLQGILETWAISAWTMAYQKLSTAPGTAPASASPAPMAS